MKKQPVIVKIVLAYLPAALLAIIFCGQPWWAGLLIALGGLLAAVLLWVFLFEDKPKVEEKESLNPDLLDAELKNMLMETAATGSALNFSLEGLKEKIIVLKGSLAVLRASFEELKETDRPLEQALEELKNQVGALKEPAGLVDKNKDAYEDYLNALKQQALNSRQVLEQSAELGEENVEAVEGVSGAKEDLERFEEQLGSILKKITSFARQANTLALNTSIKTTKLEKDDKNLTMVASDLTDLSNFINAGMEEINALTGGAEVLSDSLREKLELAAGAVSFKDMQVSALKEALKEMVTETESAAESFKDLSAAWAGFTGEADLALEVAARPLEDISSDSAGAESMIKEKALAHEKALKSARESVDWVAGQVAEFKQKAGRYDLPVLGYLDSACDKAGAYLFKHWYKRDAGGEVVLVATDKRAQAALFKAMGAGHFDATISLRVPGAAEELAEQFAGALQILGTNLAGLRQGLLVPGYVKIGTAGVLRHNKEAFGGKIYVLEEEGLLSEQVRQAQEAYKTGFELVFAEAEEVAQALEEAAAEKRWLVLAGQVPDPRFESYGLKFLTDPKKVFGEEQFMKTVTRKSLREDRPEYYRALQRFRWGLDEVLLFMKKIEAGLSYDEAALSVLKEIKFSLL